ncbi:2217_t:CDS:2 [Ambispora gerdemannii]|uniref:2217_t:CDS:1 n=1 Tax=Ambispora gerdemannii TaxID=144530 RepID=A0A9N8W6S0_9GLOM|nr:2217_t:CDS:2 [Ambispora gerdemannii]
MGYCVKSAGLSRHLYLAQLVVKSHKISGTDKELYQNESGFLS